MPKILFASNNVSHFPGAIPGSTAGSFDPNRVPYSLQLNNYGLVSGPSFTPATGTQTWFHFMTHCSGTPYNIANGAHGILWQCFDSANRMVARIVKTGSVYTQSLSLILYNGSTSLTVNGNIMMIPNRMNAIDIQIIVTTVSITANLYVNGALSATVNFGSNPNAITNPNRFSMGCCHTETMSGTQNFSEIFVSDGDSRNARLNFLRPASAGGFSEWIGTVASLGDDDPTTGIQTKVANQRQSVLLSGYTGSENISNLVSISQTTRGQNSPTKLKHSIRQSGINYDSADIAIGNSLQYNVVDLSINPATSLPFTGSDLAALEVGFLSVA